MATWPERGETPWGDKLKAYIDEVRADAEGAVSSHADDTGNPHEVTAAQAGAYTTAETDSLLAGKADASSLADVATTGSYDDLTDVPEAFPPAPHDHDGTYALREHDHDASYVQPGQLHQVATSGDYADLEGKPVLFDGDYNSLTNTPSIPDPADFASAAQGAKADTAVQPGELHSVATSGSYSDLVNTPTIPDAQVPADWDASSGVARILNKPTLGTAAGADAGDFATAIQGSKADTAVQPGDLATVAVSGSYNDLTDKPSGGNAMIVVSHGTNAGEARPAGAAAVYWIGTVAPDNGADGDLWIGGMQ